MGSKNDFKLTGYADADLAGDKQTRETTIGTLVSLNGLIIWSSKRAKCIIDSTCEAEYIAISKFSKDIEWLLILMDYLRLKISKPIIFNDNQAAIRQIHNEVVSQKLRHIDVKFHRIRSLLDKVDVEYIQSSQQLADILTKALSTQLHLKNYLKYQLLNDAIAHVDFMFNKGEC